jgi:hypothetical protein
MVAKTGIRQIIAVITMVLIALAMGITTNSCGGSSHSSSGSSGDTTRPTVMSTIPANIATGVLINRKITAIFSEAMNPATISTTTFTLLNGITPIAGTVTYTASSRTASFDPTSDLTASTEYTAKITTGVKDLAGNTLAVAKTWSFTTGTTADTTAPVVTSTSPANLATGVVINASIDATFSEAMDSSTISTTTFTLVGPGAVTVTGTVALATITATFDPASNLTASSVYTATVTTGVKDLAGNALAVAKTWTFTTGTTTGSSRSAVFLGTAGNFAILAKTGVSTTGATNVVGDIGLSPAAATFVTGFGLTADPSNEFSTSSLVTGRIYAADYTPPTPAIMTAAISDMEIAYTDAAGRTLPDFTELYSGDISGRTLVPGLYKWGTGVLINGVNTTLTGSATDVWIFQIAQNLTVGNGTIITLSGGALPQNVFWQVAGQATLGTTVNFKGIILCQTLIEMQTNTIMNGRALAQTAVTLDATAITEP